MKNFGLLILGIILGALAMYFYCCNDGITEPPEILKPAGLISSKEARTLDRAYDIRHKIISDSLFRNTKEKDNRSSWWSIEDIQNYINYAENQAGELGYTMDGLRLYLGAYPNSKDKTGLTTMFFVPTGTKNTSEGNMVPSLQGGNSNDILQADGLNKGGHGDPPSANYPQ
ncbi:hypothetical protein [Winogradskyella luteola]|uniref:Uncharacterized protein n=1 Tax=Winogradskyella luteola TaxID=2828330 RepID=A0A9X1JTC8_9FLAO|nr:hypothetical protein [Winogradskyella luteola]MBV7270502.1 hypothetical protein [Winogradskyella luteola]